MEFLMYIFFMLHSRNIAVYTHIYSHKELYILYLSSRPSLFNLTLFKKNFVYTVSEVSAQ